MKTVRNEQAGKLVRAVVIFAAVGFGVSACVSMPGLDLAKSIKTKFSSKEYGVAASPRLSNAKHTKKGGGRYSVGKPYKVRGVWYTPKHQPNYDKVGMASWYGPNFHGRQTANGEIFDMNMPSAAHKTLPLPSYVRVTNTENGRHIVVRVNDRGPYVSGRIIDLSKKAADVLGFRSKGKAKVRVQYLRRAELEGDDSAFLMATLNNYNAPGLPTLGNVSPVLRPNLSLANAASNVADGEFASDGGKFGAGSFSYAEKAPISAAHLAIDTMLENKDGLNELSAQSQAKVRGVDITLGTFASRENALRLGQAFARLGAVDLESVGASGALMTRVRLRYLKDGVSHGDIVALAAENGILVE